MRILYAIPSYSRGKEPPYTSKSWDDRDWTPALRELGHELVPFNWELDSRSDLATWQRDKKVRINDALVALAKAEHEKKRLDMALTCSDSDRMMPETIDRVKGLGIPFVNFHSDDVNVFERNSENARHFTFNWTAQLKAIDNYKRINAKYVYTPLSGNPEIYHPYPVKEEFDATFIGRNMGYREEMLQYAIDSGVDVRIWGTEWPTNFREILRFNVATTPFRNRSRGLVGNVRVAMWYARRLGRLKTIIGHPLNFEEMVKMYGRSRINLNFSGGWGPTMNDYTKAHRSLKLRDFEIPMSGGFYLTEHHLDIEKLYKIGSEIEAFHDKGEMVEKIRYYLSHPDEARAIAKAGRERALKDYTWKRTFEKLFSQIGLK